jgi:tetratricopeptide (TPR) repeat protein
VVPVARSALFPATLTSVLVSASTQTAGEDQFTAALHEHQQGQLRVAARPYEALLARAPVRFDALSNLGLVYGELGNYDGAIGLLMKALRLAPSQSNIRLNLAMTYFQAKRYRDAAGKAGQVVSAQPTSALAHYIFGLALLKTDQLEVGIGQLEMVITAQSGNPSAAATLASAYMKSHQIDKARTLVTGVLSRSDTPDAHLVIGTSALSSSTRSSRNSGLHSPKPMLWQATSTPRKTSSARAYAPIHAMPKRTPFLGWLYLQNQKPNRAQEFLDKAHALRPEDPAIDFQRARLARAQGDYEQSVTLLKTVVAAQRKSAPAHVLLARRPI